jgi:isopenicillin N synthase-like dioxygenase
LIVKGQNVTLYKNDWHEALDYYAPVDHNHTITKRGISVLSGENPYPECPEGFSRVLESYVKDMEKLGQAIMNAIALSLGLKQEYFDQFMTDPFWVIRLIGYPPLPKDHDGVSCGQHTDYGCLTILNTDDTRDALQVLSKEGEWITVNPIPGAFVINIGDMVNNWTNDLYSATLHRVIHKNTNYRISVPFFYVF